ncbi:MAG: hypothetical protein AB1529_03140 [Candidatus Micrarchaeota archaeon]
MRSVRLAWSAGAGAERRYGAWEKTKAFARAAVRLEDPLLSVAKSGLLGLHDIPDSKWDSYRRRCRRKGVVFDEAEEEYLWASGAYRFLKAGREEREQAPRTLKIFDSYRKISGRLESAGGAEIQRLTVFLDDLCAMADILAQSGAVNSKDGLEDLSTVLLLHSRFSSRGSRSSQG